MNNMSDQEIYYEIIGFLRDAKIPPETIGMVIRFLRHRFVGFNYLKLLRVRSTGPYYLFLANCQYVSIKIIERSARLMDDKEYEVIFAGKTVDEIIDLINNTPIFTEEEFAILERLLGLIKFESV